MNKIFWDFLKDNLTANEYENLHQLINCGQKRLAWIRNGKVDFHLEEIIKLGKLVDEDPRDLIMQYGIGQNNISLKEMNQLAAADGMELGLVAHVA